MRITLEIPQETIRAFCLRHHIRKLSLFGSVLTEQSGPSSDVDVLVEFEPIHVPGLIRLSGIEIELSDILDRKVDMRTHEDLSPYFRNEVLKQAEVLYGS